MAEVWMKVSHDKYELPEYVADSIQELSELCGSSVASIRSYICHAKQFGWPCNYKRVEVDDDGDI